MRRRRRASTRAPCAGGTAPRASSVGALYVVDGFIAWCADGTEQKLAKSFCAPADVAAFEDKRERDVAYFLNAGGAAAASSAYSNVLAGTTGLGEDYYGVRHEPGFIGNASGLRFTRPSRGGTSYGFHRVAATPVSPKTPPTPSGTTI